METITITKDGIKSTLKDWRYDYEYVKNLRELTDYYYLSKEGDKIRRKREKNERENSKIKLAYLTLSIFKQKLDNLTEEDRRNLKTDGNRFNVGIWKDKNKFIEIRGNPKHNPSNLKGDYIRVEYIHPYKENGDDIFYFYNCGLFDSLEMCISLMKKFEDNGSFIVEINDNTAKNEYQKEESLVKKIPLNQILYGPPGTGKTYKTIDKAIEIIEGEDFIKEIEDKYSDEKERRKKLTDKFKELLNKQIIFTTFHQSMSYEDFVEGIKPKTENSQVIYKMESGIFKKICEAAQEDSGNVYVLIIDEINRGNVSQIFGELITLIEEDKRLEKDEELKITLPYSKTEFGVPSNLYIIGTMNTADRSVEALDTALRRRFSFTEMMPDYDLLKNIEDIDNINLKTLLETINARIEKLLDRDHQIGHSYFLSIENLDDLKRTFRDKIIPLLQEYFFGDYGKIGLVLGKEFIEKISETEFADFDEPSELEEKVVYRLKNSDNFKSIYE